MNSTLTIEIVDKAAIRFLRDLETINLIRFTKEKTSEDNNVTALINEICKEVDTSIDPCLMAAQVEAIGREDW